MQKGVTMAYVSAGWKMFISMIDNGGNSTTKTYDLTSADADAAATDSAAVLAALDAVTDALITDYGYYEKMVQDTVTYPSAGVQIEDLALLEFDIVGDPTKKATITIPAPAIGIFNASSGAGANVVDTADAAVVTYRDLFRTAGECTISDGEVANSLIKGRRIHRKSRRG